MNPKFEQIENIIAAGDRTTAVIYPIILPDCLATILSVPGQSLIAYSTNLSQEEVEQTLRDL